MKKLLLSLLLLFPISSFAELRIDITKGNMDPIPLAILEFNTKDIEGSGISSDINRVISKNLERSGLF